MSTWNTWEYYHFKNQDGEYSLVEFFEDMYEYNLNSLKEYMEDKEKKKERSIPQKMWIFDLDIYPWISEIMKIINAFPGKGDNDWRRDEKFYVNNNNLLIRIGLIDEEGEPNVIPLQSQYPHGPRNLSWRQPSRAYKRGIK